MGAIIASRNYTITTLNEMIGYKSGVALSLSQMRELAPDYLEILDGDGSEIIKIRAEEFAEIHNYLLYRIGNIPSPNILTPGQILFSKYGNNPETWHILEVIAQNFAVYIHEQAQNPENLGKPLDGDRFMQSILDRYGPGSYIEVALEYLQAVQSAMVSDPWSEVRRIEWRNVVELSNLFQSENLHTYYGHFFDQRFIDYLAANFGDISQINWRKFEGLVCEYFDREGFQVQIGPGRNDDNIDARIWPKAVSQELPPDILVQCKRQSDKVGKVIVKALYADILAEEAHSGLIVTTSSLSPGARKILTARGYPINEINRTNLLHWIEKMRTPQNGILFGE